MTPAPKVFSPFPGQKVFMESVHPELLYSGSLGAGKTLVGLNKILFLATYYPGNELLICRKVGADLPGTTLKTWWEEVLPPDYVIQKHETKHYVTIRTRGTKPSRIWWTGLDRVLRLGGTQFGGVFFDECVEAEEDDWNMLEGRLRHPDVPFHQLMGATNPGAPTHFLHDRFIKHGDERDQETGEPLRLIVHANSLQNPRLPESYRRRLNRFTGVYRERFVLGKWIGYAGLVYSDFNPGLHIVPTFTVPPEWRRLRSVDFGAGNPFSCSWYAQEPSTDTWFQYRQTYMTGRTVRVHGKQILSLTQGERIEDTISDHDLSARLELEDCGIDTIPAKKDLDQGIQKVQHRLSARPGITAVPIGGERTLEFPGGAPGILFLEDALVEEDPALLVGEKKVPLRTTHEFGYYRWAKSAGGVLKNVPVKEHDHGLDELRYLLMHVDAVDTMAWATVETGADPVQEAIRQALASGEMRVSTPQDRIAERRRRRQAREDADE